MRKRKNTAIKYFSMSLILDAQIFYTTARNKAYKVWQEHYKTFDMKGSKDLLRLMTKFANYEPKLHLRLRIWFLLLDMKRQEIKDGSGSKTAADIVHQIMDKAPKEYMTEK